MYCGGALGSLPGPRGGTLHVLRTARGRVAGARWAPASGTGAPRLAPLASACGVWGEASSLPQPAVLGAGSRAVRVSVVLDQCNLVGALGLVWLILPITHARGPTHTNLCRRSVAGSA